MFRETAASSAANGDITAETKRPIAYHLREPRNPSPLSLLSSARAMTNSERWDLRIIIIHHGTVRRSDREVTHSEPRRSTYQPANGEAVWKHKIIADEQSVHCLTEQGWNNSCQK